MVVEAESLRGCTSATDFGRCICCPYITNDGSLTWEALILHAVELQTELTVSLEET